MTLMAVDLGPDLSATFRNGKLTILSRGVVREFRSVSDYLDSIAARGGRVSIEVTQALREMERLMRYRATDFDENTTKEKGGTPHWL